MSKILTSLIKFFLAVILLPVVYASAITLPAYLTAIKPSYYDYFMWGVGAFLLIFLFLYQFWGPYEFGQKLVSGLFRFAGPLDKYFGYAIPFYTVVVLLIFFFMDRILNVPVKDHQFLFFIGFTFAFNILLSAQDLQNRVKSPFDPAYLFIMTLVFIFNMLILVLLFDCLQGKFQFLEYFSSLSKQAGDVYARVFARVAAY